MTLIANTDRRNLLGAGLAFLTIPGAVLHAGWGSEQEGIRPGSNNSSDKRPAANQGTEMQIAYLEIVTTDVDAVCATFSQMHGVTFSDPDSALGGARTVRLASGETIGVRARMNATEKPVVRPYILVADIEAAVAAAAEAGAEILLPPMKLEGHGTCAIIYQGEIESGLWQR